jgi:chaperonin GroES
MRGVLDHYIVEMECLYESSLLVGSGLYSSHDFEKTISESGGDVIYNPNKLKRTYAKIIASPQGLSGRAKEWGYSKVFREGDTVHFYWSAINDDRLISQERLYGQLDDKGRVKMRYVYRLPVWSAICASSGNHVEMGDGFLLAEATMQDESDIRTKSGIYLQEQVKAKDLCATLVKSNGFHEGKDIYYLPNSDLTVTILGKEYYAMRESDVFALRVGDNPIPIGSSVLLAPESPDEKTAGGLYIPDTAKKYPPRGTALEVGPDCKGVCAGDRIWFEGAPTELKIDGNEYIMVREEQIIMKDLLVFEEA